jgi:diaminopimelate decarboxylase
MATGTSVSDVFPLHSRLSERGRLEVGGCDAIELAREFGTPAYVVAEDDLRARARAFLRGGREAGHDDFHVVFASKAFPCTAVLELFAQEGLWCDVASGGELHLALRAGFSPERIVLHGNAKSEAELRMALRHRVGLIAVDNFDEIDRLERLLTEGAAIVQAAHAGGLGAEGRLLIEPGRALCANAGVTLYSVESVRHNVSLWVAVDGGMSDNIRPMLYGAAIEAHVADRFDGSTPCVLAGKHCESGDVLVREAMLDEPRAGDVIVTPATGAYGYAMASNYNGVPRPPVIFCRDGDARVVVRRESFDDLTARDAL